MDWVPQRVTIEKTDSPLGFTIQRPPISTDAEKVAQLLDTMGVPKRVSRATATTVLQQADEGRRAEVVADAVKFRQAQPQTVPAIEEQGPEQVAGTGTQIALDLAQQ
jgi:hypothetical protein